MKWSTAIVTRSYHTSHANYYLPIVSIFLRLFFFSLLLWFCLPVFSVRLFCTRLLSNSRFLSLSLSIWTLFVTRFGDLAIGMQRTLNLDKCLCLVTSSSRASLCDSASSATVSASVLLPYTRVTFSFFPSLRTREVELSSLSVSFFLFLFFSLSFSFCYYSMRSGTI